MTWPDLKRGPLENIRFLRVLRTGDRTMRSKNLFFHTFSV